jgi:hypothetical protein
LKKQVHLDVCSTSHDREKSMLQNSDPFGNLQFRVLEERDQEYNILVARCLETGTTVTAEDTKTLRDLIKQALQLHITLAAESGKPEAIYYQRATADVWVRYAAASAPREQVTIEVDVPGASRRGVKSEISIAQIFRRETA